MKTYHLKYNFQGVERHIKTQSVFEFSQALDTAIENPHVLANSVTFWTEE